MDERDVECEETGSSSPTFVFLFFACSSTSGQPDGSEENKIEAFRHSPPLLESRSDWTGPEAFRLIFSCRLSPPLDRGGTSGTDAPSMLSLACGYERSSSYFWKEGRRVRLTGRQTSNDISYNRFSFTSFALMTTLWKTDICFVYL